MGHDRSALSRYCYHRSSEFHTFVHRAKRIDPGFSLRMTSRRDESRAALGADLDALLRAELQEFPLYLNEDSDGNLYRIALERTKDGTYTSETAPVTDQELKELESIGHRILITPDGQTPRSVAIAEGESSSVAVSSTCPLPANFNMSGLLCHRLRRWTVLTKGFKLRRLTAPLTGSCS